MQGTSSFLLSGQLRLDAECPPKEVLTQATDMASKKVGGIVVAKARQKIDLAEKMFAEDFRSTPKLSGLPLGSLGRPHVSIVQVQGKEVSLR